MLSGNMSGGRISEDRPLCLGGVSLRHYCALAEFGDFGILNQASERANFVIVSCLPQNTKDSISRRSLPGHLACGVGGNKIGRFRGGHLT